MLLIKINKLKKYFGDRLLLDIDELKVYQGDKIGIVGVNGVGKTTLLEIITGNMDYDSGNLLVCDKNLKYVSQLGKPINKTINGEYKSIFKVDNVWRDNMSGGEKTRFKLAEGFQSKPNLLLVDEPTCNLDIDGIDLIIEKFQDFSETILVVSHDRHFLDSVCNKILEIDHGKCKLYDGNYSMYMSLKEAELIRSEFEYNEFIKERNRLTEVKRNIKEKSGKIRKAPKRMGNSESRLHKMGGQSNKKKMENSAKAIQSRINQLEVKEKPKEESTIRIKILENSRPFSKILVSGNRINKHYEEFEIFNDSSFNIYNGKKVALIGPNGSGKTTLINMILNSENIKISKGVKFGYFSQSMSILDENKTILENVMESNIHGMDFSRLILARLLIRGDVVHERLSILSGGERVKVSFAKIILGDINFLILDEPTNYLDIRSMEVIEELLLNYDGTVLIVSHDVRFIDRVADELLIIKDKKIKQFSGNYSQYKESILIKPNKLDRNNEETKMILEMEISGLISQLSGEISADKKEQLEQEYLKKVKALKTIESE